MSPDDDRSAGLVAWQHALYPRGHRDRRNLVIHILTVPLFLAGTVALGLAWHGRPHRKIRRSKGQKTDWEG